MTLDQTKLKELNEMIDEIHDLEAEKKEAVSTWSKRISDQKNTLKDWAEKNQLDVDNIMAIQKQVSDFRNGKINWADGEDDNYFTILNAIVDKLIKPNK